MAFCKRKASMRKSDALFSCSEIPFMKLPIEVTCMIFEYAAPYSTVRSQEPAKLLLPEVVVSHVCRTWRKISLGFPRLWTAFSHDASLTPRVPLDRFDAYLERSTSHHLDLWFGFKKAGKFTEHFKLLENALPHIARWRCFTFSSDTHSDILAVLRFLGRLKSTAAPQLQHISLRPAFGDLRRLGIMAPHVDTNTASTLFVDGAPKLRSLMLDGTSGFIYLPLLSNITTLRIEVPDGHAYSIPLSWPTLQHVLSVPSLTNLSLVGEMLDITDSHFDPQCPIKMGSLKHLRFGSNDALIFILSVLHAPLLETLFLDNIWLPFDMVTIPVATDIGHGSHAFPLLKSVSFSQVHSSSVYPHETLYFARMLESATEICICNKSYVDSMFETLLNDRDLNQKYWTNVKHVTLCPRVAKELEDVIRFAADRPENGLVVHVSEETVKYWKKYKTEYTSVDVLKKWCSIDVIHSMNPPWSGPWPPGDCTPIDRLSDGGDPFDMNLYFEPFSDGNATT
ncbi:hypothetical protein CPB84DRAFT_1708404 [Gymnopilus junonius]|uniref:F-box domain-containing protein n=1 Tax=Gymnopilus junonius TaxID=109634 RepID=A0A9P5TPB9_GYMJU|nr:hypothetical protein CPB84DRAFT_1708404 [Gymnopilus junonius]